MTVIKKYLKIALALLVVAFVVIQIIPYGRDHTNPPVSAEPPWDTPATRDLAQRACFDCHSNETVWPWYSNIAPVSWLMHPNANLTPEETSALADGLRQSLR